MTCGCSASALKIDVVPQRWDPMTMNCGTIRKAPVAVPTVR